MPRHWFRLQSALLVVAFSCILNANSAAAGLYATLVVAHGFHTCAIRNDGTVVCWGNNGDGQLGIGSTNIVGDNPNEMGNNLQVVDLGTGLYAIALIGGYQHTCAMRSNQSVVCWGRNYEGQLGIGNTNSIGDNPNEMGNNLQAVDFGTGLHAVAVAAGYYHTCAVRSDGSVVCWGDNGYGELGIGSTNNVGDNPNEMGINLQAVDLGTGQHATALVAGYGHTCALRSDGSVVCWGRNNYGQLGIGSTNSVGTAAGQMGSNLLAVDLGTGRYVNTMTSGAFHICALLSGNGSVVCWGSNSDGQLGSGNTNNIGNAAGQMGNNLPVVNIGTGLYATALVAGELHNCVVRNDTSMVCWGWNPYGQLGIGNTNSIGKNSNDMGNNLQAVDLGTGLHATAIISQYQFTCAIRSDSNRSVVCWGHNDYGQLGIGNVNTIGDNSNEMGNNLQAADLGTGCSVGSYASTRGSSVCSGCNAGTYSTQTGVSVCNGCNAGSYWSGTGASVCTGCIPGSYSTGAGASVCSGCSAGSYSTKTGANTSASCLQCLAGSYSSSSDWVYAGANSSNTCILCGPGVYSLAGANRCSNCSLGYYSTATGASTCTSCPPGSYLNFSAGANFSCVNCSLLGTYAASGFTACQACPAGTYSNQTATGVCTQCSAGFFQPLSGSSSCRMCGIGSYQNVSGKTVCVTCPRDGATPGPASASDAQCEQCGVGKMNWQDMLVQFGPNVTTGGLGLLSTTGVYTWWCLPVAASAPQNRTCFKYDENAALFHYWGSCSDLKLC